MEIKNLSELLNNEEISYVNECLNNNSLSQLREYLNDSSRKIRLINNGVYPDYLYYYLLYSSTKSSVKDLENSLNRNR